MLKIVAGSLALAGSAALAQDGPILFTNVDIFDGQNLELIEDMNVVVTDNLITQITADDVAVAGGQVIDGDGMTLMPGMADTHTHIMFASLPQMALLVGDPSYNYIYATKDAEAMLMRGVTFIRDMGGDSFGLKKAVDQGLVPGPRIYPAGPVISQTGGHGDFRFPNQLNPRFGGHVQPLYLQGHAALVDGVPDMLAGAREALRKGGSHIKVAAGGGYSSPSDPLLGTQFTEEEIAAAVSAAENFGTYVTIHAYTTDAIGQALDAGVKDVGHGQLLDQATLQRMADTGVFLSTQPFTECSEPQLDDFSNSKLAIVCEGTAKVYQWAKEIPELKVTYGTDLFFVSPDVFETQIKQMERLLPWYEPGEILKMATGNAGELVAMSGPNQNPYQDGPMGVVQEGAYADLLLVDGNPLETLDAVTDTDNLKIIMKNGVIYKNTLEE